MSLNHCFRNEVEISYSKSLMINLKHNIDNMMLYLKNRSLNYLMLDKYFEFKNYNGTTKMMIDKTSEKYIDEIVTTKTYFKTIKGLFQDICKIGINEYNDEDIKALKNFFRQFYTCIPNDRGCTKKTFLNLYRNIFKEELVDPFDDPDKDIVNKPVLEEPKFDLTFDKTHLLFDTLCDKLYERDYKIHKETNVQHILEGTHFSHRTCINTVVLGKLTKRISCSNSIFIHEYKDIWKELKLDNDTITQLNKIIDFCKFKCNEFINSCNYIEKIKEERSKGICNIVNTENVLLSYDDNCYTITHRIHMSESDTYDYIDIAMTFTIYVDKNNKFVDLDPKEMTIICDKWWCMESNHFSYPEREFPNNNCVGVIYTDKRTDIEPVKLEKSK